jgi:hypothetical protein
MGGSLRFTGTQVVLSQDIIIANANAAISAINSLTTTGRISGTGSLTIAGGPAYLSGYSQAGDGTFRINVGAGLSYLTGSYTNRDASLFASYLYDATKCTLAGNGTFLGSFLTHYATVAPGVPGAPAGVLVLGPSTWYSSRLNVDIFGIGPDQYDRLVVFDSLLIRPESYYANLLSINLQYTPTIGDQFLLIDDRFTGAVSGWFADLPEETVFANGGTFFSITYTGGDGNDVVLTVVPEPSVEMLALGVFTFAWRRRSPGNQ